MYLTYDEVVSAILRLSSRLSLSAIGLSESGRRIYCLSHGSGGRRVVVASGARPHERLPVLLSLMLSADVARGAISAPRSASLHVVPVACPDGYERWIECSSRELGALRDLVASLRPSVFIEIGSGWMRGAYVLSGTDRERVARALGRTDVHEISFDPILQLARDAGASLPVRLVVSEELNPRYALASSIYDSEVRPHVVRALQHVGSSSWAPAAIGAAAAVALAVPHVRHALFEALRSLVSRLTLK